MSLGMEEGKRGETEQEAEVKRQRWENEELREVLLACSKIRGKRKDIYRDSGAGSVGAIARGRQRGQRPAPAIRPGGERGIKEMRTSRTNIRLYI